MIVYRPVLVKDAFHAGIGHFSSVIAAIAREWMRAPVTPDVPV